MLEENSRMLKEAREARGLSYAEVEEATKVREYYLQLLESGDVDKLPGRIYALGFAETYAKFLGVDAAPLLDDIKAHYAAASADAGFEAYVSGKKVVQAVGEGGSFTPDVKQKAEQHLADKNTKSEEATRLRTAAYSHGALGRPIHTRKRSFGRRFLWLLLASIVVALLLVLYMLQDNATLPGMGNDGGLTASDIGQNVVQDEADAISVIVTAIDEPIWVGINVDDGNVSQISLETGLSYAISGRELVYLRFNNATHTQVEYNGKVLDGYNEGHDVWNMNFYADTWEGFDDSVYNLS